jgi:probable phosphoglycerate mutase
VLAALHATAWAYDRAERVVVFTHGMPVNIVLAHALGLDSITNFLVGYGSVTRLRRRENGGYGVSSVNETAHHRSED